MNFTKDELDSMPVPAGKVVFLGSNPSCSSPYNDPFSHCKSANKMLNQWIPALGLTRDQVHFMNVANYKTPRNRPLKRSEIDAEIPRLIELLRGQIVVTLGKTAGDVMLDMLECGLMAPNQQETTIFMPHPSGRNRKLNDREWVNVMLGVSRFKLQQALGRVQR